jgi:hypothetical protein
MTTAASDGYCTPSAAFDCEGAAGSIKGCSKKTAITRDVQIANHVSDDSEHVSEIDKW